MTGPTIDRPRRSPPGLAYRLICLTSAMALGLLDAATSKADPPSPVPNPPAGNAVTLEDLLSASVPGLCRHDPGTW